MSGQVDLAYAVRGDFFMFHLNRDRRGLPDEPIASLALVQRVGPDGRSLLASPVAAGIGLDRRAAEALRAALDSALRSS